MCVCVCVCVGTCVCACEYVCMRECVSVLGVYSCGVESVCVCVCVSWCVERVSVYSRVWGVYIYVCVCVGMCVWVCMRECVSVCVYVGVCRGEWCVCVCGLGRGGRSVVVGGCVCLFSQTHPHTYT